jgi:starch synthase
MPRVLYCTSEMFPLANTGGLGDVAAALPAALRELGADVHVIMPAYPSALATAVKQGKPVAIGSPGRLGTAALIPARTPDTEIQVWLVDCPALYDRPGGPYGDEQGTDWPDNAERFAMLSHAAALMASNSTPLAWRPELVHCNDWQTGLVPAILATRREGRSPTVFTIHNLSFLGLFPKETFPLLSLPASAFGVDGVEFFGGVSLMKAGISYSDRITTVSKTYAKEIRTQEFGCGLEGLLAYRAHVLTGILNGADYARWDPSRDPHIAAQYAPDSLDGKRACKAALQSEMGLDVRDDAFLLGSVSRLTTQKGLDLLMDALPSVIDRNTQLVMLGSGDPVMERGFVAAMNTYPGRLAVRLGFDDPLAHRIEAGSDAFVMPSRFEPCGLNQMYSLKYGTPPIVHRVGGLADTVENGVTGFTFDVPNAAALAAAIKRAASTFARPAEWLQMQRRAMAKDFGWPHAAREYLAVYDSLLRPTLALEKDANRELR